VDVSLVIPVFNEEESVGLLHRAIAASMASMPVTWEAVFVDDGSTDATVEHLKAVVAEDPCVKLVVLRRNFGQTAAIQAGVDHSTGEILVFLDGDLQNDPADIPMLLAKLDEGYDVVSGWRKDRQDPLLTRRVPSSCANWIISRATGVRLHDYGCTLKAYRREVLTENRLYGDMHRFIPALASWSGARIAEVPVRHHPRKFGRSKYGLFRTVRVVLDLLTLKFLGSYSTKPSYLFGGVGLVFWFLGACAALVVLGTKIFPPHHYSYNVHLSLVAGFCCTLGTLFLMLGLLAELSIRTYHESQSKPTYIVRALIPSPAGGRSDEPVPAPEDPADRGA
jgi:glycosyltransferase involved in cell wall biosynthesis